MIVSVPNSKVMRKIDPQNKELLNQPPHHMCHWDESVFRALESLMPVKVKSVHQEPLASYHIAWMANSYLKSLLSPLNSNVQRLLVNNYSTLPLQWLMRAGVSKFFPGHTILAEFMYQPN